MSIITGVIKTLTSKFGVTLPVTVTKAVYDETTGEKLDATISEIKNEIGEVSTLTTTAKTMAGAVNELDADMSKHLMQSFISPEHLGLERNGCTLIDLFNALPYFGILSYWIGTNSAQIQSEIAAQIGRNATDVFGILTVTKTENLAGNYTFYEYGETPNLTYTASYDLVNGTTTWKNFRRNATAEYADSLQDMTLVDKGIVTDTLMDSIEKGFYYYGENTIGAPSSDAGVILSLPAGEAYTMRIALTAGHQMYINVHVSGITYGDWRPITA